ncbi:MAG: hypothetical protein NVSMB26_21840 [Beijerinckiaceae bacterium]
MTHRTELAKRERSMISFVGRLRDAMGKGAGSRMTRPRNRLAIVLLLLPALMANAHSRDLVERIGRIQ